MKLFPLGMRHGIYLLVLMLAGCGTQSGGSSGSSQQNETQAYASAKIHTELAAQYYERAQLGIALEELDIALRAMPDYAPAYSMRALVNMELREYQKADHDFRKSLRLDNSNAETHNNYGWFLCQRGKELDSIEHFMAALKNPLYSTPEKAYLNAGVCSRKGGKLQDAEEFLKKALRIQPSMSEALLGLAELSFAKGNHAEAKSYFKRYVQSSPSPLTAANLWLAVRIERRLGDRKAEESYAAQLRQRFPDAKETQLMRRGQ